MKRRRGTRTPQSQARPGNRNAQKSVEMPDCDLSTRLGVQRFVRDFLIPTAVSGKLGVRTITALTTCAKLLLDSQEADLLEVLEGRIRSLEEVKGMKAN
jgi:hypothetical protein